MKKILFNEDLDFAFFTDIISNLDYFNTEINKLRKDTIIVFDEELLLNYSQFINTYYNSLNYIEKKFLETYFNQCKLFTTYLIYILFHEMSFIDINIFSFKSFLNAYFDEEISNEISKKGLYLIIKNKDSNLNKNIDINKTASLIISILNDNDILLSFRNEIMKFKEMFKSNLVNKDLEYINYDLKNIQLSADNDEESFLKRISPFYENTNIKTFQPYYSYYCPFNHSLHINSKAFIFGDFILRKNDVDDKKYLLLLNKYLSFPKRYQIIKLLSKRKYYSNELAKELNLSAATMNYHINKLYDLGLIIIEEGKQNILYLELNKKRLNYLLDLMKEDLLNN